MIIGIRASTQYTCHQQQRGVRRHMYGVVEMGKDLMVEDMNRSLYVVQACTLDSTKLLKEVIVTA